MKKLKIITLTAIAVTSLQEVSYPILFTGPARRSAHRNQREEAYKLGLVDSQKNRNDELSEIDADDGNVEIQALGGGDILARLTPEQKATIHTKIDALKARLNNNVQVQSIDSKDLEYKDHEYKEDYTGDRNIKIQSLGNDDSSAQLSHNDSAQLSSSEDAAVNQALRDAGLDDDLLAALQDNVVVQAAEPEQASNAEVSTENSQEQAPTLTMELTPVALEETQPVSTSLVPTQSPEPQAASSQEDSTSPTEEIAVLAAPVVEDKEKTQSDLAAPVVEDKEKTQSESIEDKEQIQPASAANPATPELPVALVSMPSDSEAQNVTTEEIAAPIEKAEQVKIVKVYPVYEAIHSALQRVHAATQDMINYVYNFVAKKSNSSASEKAGAKIV